jgi:hypothetical protein
MQCEDVPQIVHALDGSVEKSILNQEVSISLDKR